jgi:hypothetical protein
VCDINGSSDSDLDNNSSIKSSGRYTDYGTTRKQDENERLNQLFNSSSKKEIFPLGENPEENK